VPRRRAALERDQAERPLLALGRIDAGERKTGAPGLLAADDLRPERRCQDKQKKEGREHPC
jgi:hypothetical protein